MKVEIKRFHYSNLWNSEFPLVIEQIISICEKYNMEDMQLQKSFDQLISHRQQLNSMNVYVRKHAKIVEIGIFDSERDTLINGLWKTVKSLEHIDLPEVKPHAEILYTLFTKHKVQTIAAANRTSETERITMLENDIASRPEIRAALAALNLTPITQRLFEVNHKYERLFREFIAEKSAEEHLDVPALRRDCTLSLVKFFDALEYCAFANENINYLPLSNEINELNSYYKQQLKARATRHKNNKDAAKEDPIVPLKN